MTSLLRVVVDVSGASGAALGVRVLEAWSISIHNPDQHMALLRTIIAQGRKRLGLLVGTGAAAGTTKDEGLLDIDPGVSLNEWEG